MGGARAARRRAGRTEASSWVAAGLVATVSVVALAVPWHACLGQEPLAESTGELDARGLPVSVISRVAEATGRGSGTSRGPIPAPDPGARASAWTLAAMLAGLDPTLMSVPVVPTDANHDGRLDAENILLAIDELSSVGVVFDDTDADGHRPVRREDGRYHMACVDLILVAYRAAGYDFPALIAEHRQALDAAAGASAVHAPGKGGDAGRDRSRTALSRARSVASLIEYLKESDGFHYYNAGSARPVGGRWVPSVPFRVGDMVFLHYVDSADRHSGIVTEVDTDTGLPRIVAQVSPYNPDGGLRLSTLEELFRLRCRRLTGWGRPAAWDGRKVSPPPPPPAP